MLTQSRTTDDKTEVLVKLIKFLVYKLAIGYISVKYNIELSSNVYGYS